MSSRCVTAHWSRASRKWPPARRENQRDEIDFARSPPRPPIEIISLHGPERRGTRAMRAIAQALKNHPALSLRMGIHSGPQITPGELEHHLGNEAAARTNYRDASSGSRRQSRSSPKNRSHTPTLRSSMQNSTCPTTRCAKRSAQSSSNRSGKGPCRTKLAGQPRPGADAVGKTRRSDQRPRTARGHAEQRRSARRLATPA